MVMRLVERKDQSMLSARQKPSMSGIVSLNAKAAYLGPIWCNKIDPTKPTLLNTINALPCKVDERSSNDNLYLAGTLISLL